VRERGSLKMFLVVWIMFKRNTRTSLRGKWKDELEGKGKTLVSTVVSLQKWYDS
jgi:hypothetical protein